MEKTYWLRRKRASLRCAENAASSEARLAHYDLAGRYSLKVLDAAIPHLANPANITHAVTVAAAAERKDLQSSAANSATRAVLLQCFESDAGVATHSPLTSADLPMRRNAPANGYS
jgi:hypothetical protein